MPLSMMANIEILSLGDDSDAVQSGILTRVMPVNSMVRAGDVVATVMLPPRIQTIKISSNDANDDDQDEQKDEKEVAIYAPQTGRVTEVFHQIRDPVKIGDYLMHIDDKIVQADIKALEEQLQKIMIGQQQQEKPKLPDDYVKTLLEIEDPSRLQTIVQHIPAPLQSLSLPLYERLMELQKEDPTELANTHTQIGVVMYNLGDLEMTLHHLHKALELREEALGSDHPQVAATCIHLGALYRNSGDFESSLKYMLQAVDIQKKSLGEEHPVVASTYNNIGALHYQSNDFARAIREYEKALNIHLKDSGELHVDTAGTYHNLGVAWKHLGDFKTAKEYLQKALHVRQHHYKQQQIACGEEKGEKSSNAGTAAAAAAAADVAVSHTALGQLYAEMVNHEAAMEQYDAALVIQKQIFGPDSPMAATGHNNIGAIHYERGKYADALKEYQTGLEILSAKEPNHIDTAASWNNVGLTNLKMGEAGKALEHHQEALRILTGIYGPKHPNLATTIGSIGNVYKIQELWKKALTEYEVAHELLESALGTSHHPDVASSYNNIGLVLSQLPGREEEALEKYRAACESFAKSMGSQHPHCGSCHFNIALMLQSQGLKEDAKTEFEAARDIWTTHFGPGHVHTENAQKGVDECS
jgi:tetratricopeptide (TPR) repeat protein